MPVRFYNPGNKTGQKLAYDHPTNDPRNQNLIAYWPFSAPERDFFDVPTEIGVVTPNGPLRLSVDFPNVVLKSYQDYGMIRIDPEAVEINPADNLAVSETDAREKGDRKFREYLEEMAREHVDNVNRAKAMNQMPKRAHGIYSQALNVLGIADPADQVGSVIESNRNTSENSALKQELDELRAMVKSLLAKGTK